MDLRIGQAESTVAETSVIVKLHEYHDLMRMHSKNANRLLASKFHQKKIIATYVTDYYSAGQSRGRFSFSEENFQIYFAISHYDS